MICIQIFPPFAELMKAQLSETKLQLDNEASMDSLPIRSKRIEVTVHFVNILLRVHMRIKDDQIEQRYFWTYNLRSEEELALWHLLSEFICFTSHLCP